MLFSGYMLINKNIDRVDSTLCSNFFFIFAFEIFFFCFHKNMYKPQPVVRQSNFLTHVALAMPVKTLDPLLHPHTHLPDTNAFWNYDNINFARNGWAFCGFLLFHKSAKKIVHGVINFVFFQPTICKNDVFNIEICQNKRFWNNLKFDIWIDFVLVVAAWSSISIVWPCHCCQWRI